MSRFRPMLKFVLAGAVVSIGAAGIGTFIGYPPGTWRMNPPPQRLANARSVSAFDDPFGLMRGAPSPPELSRTIPIDIAEFRRWVASAEWSRFTDAYKVPPFGLLVTFDDGSEAFVAVNLGAQEFRVLGTPGVWRVKSPSDELAPSLSRSQQELLRSRRTSGTGTN